jgi:hypothetical protein
MAGGYNQVSLMAHHESKWENAKVVDDYYVVGVRVIPYPRYGVLIYIVSSEDIAYSVAIGKILLCTCPNFIKISYWLLGRKGKHLSYVFKFLCKVDYNSDKFIHAPTYSYNEVMQLLELVGVIECGYYSKCCV